MLLWAEISSTTWNIAPHLKSLIYRLVIGLYLTLNYLSNVFIIHLRSLRRGVIFDSSMHHRYPVNKNEPHVPLVSFIFDSSKWAFCFFLFSVPSFPSWRLADRMPILTSGKECGHCRLEVSFGTGRWTRATRAKQPRTSSFCFVSSSWCDRRRKKKSYPHPLDFFNVL